MEEQHAWKKQEKPMALEKNIILEFLELSCELNPLADKEKMKTKHQDKKTPDK